MAAEIGIGHLLNSRCRAFRRRIAAHLLARAILAGRNFSSSTSRCARR
jgi:hypothetical protein